MLWGDETHTIYQFIDSFTRHTHTHTHTHRSSSEFLSQEYSDPAKIFETATNLQFPSNGILFAKGKCKPGKDQRPTYKYLGSVLPALTVKWNFSGQFVVGKDGKALQTNPKNVVADVRRLLD